MRLATFNVENLGEGPGLAARIAVLRPQILRLDADILCLQEVDAARPLKAKPRVLAALDRLVADTPYAEFSRAVTHSAHPESGPMDVHNLVVLSRFPIRDVRQIWHETVPPPEAHLGPEGAALALKWDRPLLAVTIDWKGAALHVVNLHLRAALAAFVGGGKTGPFSWGDIDRWADGYFAAAVKRVGQALETRRYVSGLLKNDPGALIAVAGDFNAEANEMPVRLMLAAEDDTGAGALAPQSLIALARAAPESNRFSVRHHGRPQLLDHILVSRGLYARFQGVEIHNEALGDEAAVMGRVESPAGSYHAPVLASFSEP
jgi:endonuclease/exonuclease/phosphatase family metal-dependent hydrolase